MFTARYELNAVITAWYWIPVSVDSSSTAVSWNAVYVHIMPSFMSESKRQFDADAASRCMKLVA